jgi:hypothetical protein
MSKYNSQGDIITAAQIRAAIRAGTAKIIYSRMLDGGIGESIDLNCEGFDTRGQCYSMADEQWTAPLTGWSK